MINHPIESQQTQNQQSDKFCSECKEEGNKNIKAKYWCDDCSQFYCEKHSFIIHKFRAFKDHKPTLLNFFEDIYNPIERVCQKHQLKYEYYCINDEEILCAKCILDSHNNHEIKQLRKCGKIIQSVDDEFNDIQNQIRQMIKHKNSFLTKILQETNNIQEQNKYYTKLVNEQIQTLFQCLDRRKKEILLSIGKEQSQKILLLGEQSEQVKGSIEYIEQFKKYINFFKKSKKNNDYFGMMKQKIEISKIKKFLKEQDFELNAKSGTNKIFVIDELLQSIESLTFHTSFSVEESSIIMEEEFYELETINVEVFLKFLKNKSNTKNKIYINCTILDTTNKIIFESKDVVSKVMEDNEKHRFNIKYQIEEYGDFKLKLEINNTQFPLQAFSMRKLTIKSNILNNKQVKELMKYLPKNKKYHLNFDKNKHGSKNDLFHRYCDFKGSSVVVCINEMGFVFGGYSDIGWGNTNGGEYIHSDNCFLFYCGNNSQLPKILKLTGSDNDKALVWGNDYGPVFGPENSIYITKDFQRVYHRDSTVYENPPNGSMEFYGHRSWSESPLRNLECFCENK
ncbi:hypothetical protein M0813_27507 [Anaeramoeba flamelloides]|uniref:B box-type domain-containing protein n=1 Tax=Anaeramoeba flamelloides TaxID=1746091 RepID=A0ABQ8XXU0_9EUKA|nr:hypothetical protein M0813_27507 [Anaeramoeba flamelloides]